MRDVQLDWNDPVRTLQGRPRPGQGARAGPHAGRRARWSRRRVMNGATLSQLREREDLIDIVARAVPERAPRTSTR